MNIDLDTFSTFIKAVHDMRSKQRSYFLNRNQTTLILAKNAEKVVDGWLNHYQDIKFMQSSVTSQQELFD